MAMPEHRGVAEETAPHANPMPKTICSSTAQKALPVQSKKFLPKETRSLSTDAPLLA